jgi:hypothetical protein
MVLLPYPVKRANPSVADLCAFRGWGGCSALGRSGLVKKSCQLDFLPPPRYFFEVVQSQHGRLLTLPSSSPSPASSAGAAGTSDGIVQRKGGS